MLLLSTPLFGLLTWARLHHGVPELFVADAYYYYSYLPSWWIDGDLDLTNQFLHRPEEAALYGRLPTLTGRPSNPFSIGMAVMLSPAFLLVRAAHGFAGNGWSLSYQLPLYAVAFGYAVAGIVLTACLVRRFYSALNARVTAVTLAAGTTWAGYIWFEPSLSHGVSAFCVALYLLALCRAQEDPRLARMALAGAALGLAALIRPQNALLAILVPFVLRRLELRGCGVMGLAALAVFSPQMIVWRAIYGWWLGVPQGNDFMLWHRPMIPELLFSTNHGLFTWSPLLLLAVPGFFLVPQPLRTVSVGAAIFLAIQVYVNSVVLDWWAGAAFGMRRMADYLPLVALVFAATVARLERRPFAWRALLCTCAIGVGLNWMLAVRYYSGELPSVGEVPLRQLWGETVTFPVRLPRDRRVTLVRRADATTTVTGTRPANVPHAPTQPGHVIASYPAEGVPRPAIPSATPSATPTNVRKSPTASTDGA